MNLSIMDYQRMQRVMKRLITAERTEAAVQVQPRARPAATDIYVELKLAREAWERFAKAVKP